MSTKRSGSVDPGCAVGCAGLYERLKVGAAILSLIDRRRQDTGAASLGQNVEKMIIDRELNELSKNFRDPKH